MILAEGKMLSKSEKRTVEREAEKIRPGDFLGKNHKVLRDGETYQKRVGADIRIQYQIEGTKIKILDIFKKKH